MGYCARVALREPGLKDVGDACVEMLSGEALKNADILHDRSRLRQGSGATAFARMQTFEPIGSSRLVGLPSRSPLGEGEDWWRRRESDYLGVLIQNKLLSFQYAQNASDAGSALSKYV